MKKQLKELGHLSLGGYSLMYLTENAHVIHLDEKVIEGGNATI